MSEEKGKRKRDVVVENDSDDPTTAHKAKKPRYLDTEPLLKKKVVGVKQQRKEKRSQMTLNQKVESSQQHFLNDELDPGVTPGTAESKVRWGARRPLAPVMRREQLEENNPDVLYDMPDLDALEAEALADLERQSMDIDRIASHFISPSHFKESSPNASAAVSLTSGGKTKRALQSDSTAEAPGRTESTTTRNAVEMYAAAAGRKTHHQKDVDRTMKQAAEEGRERRRLNRQRRRLKEELQKQQTVEGGVVVKLEGERTHKNLDIPKKYHGDPALFEGNPESNSEFAIMNWRGLYQMSKDDIEQFKDLTRKQIKPRQPPDEFMIPTDAPPTGNASVVASRRSFLRHRAALEQEAEDALDKDKQGTPSTGALPKTTASGVPLNLVGGPEPSAMFAVERRDVKTVDPKVYDDPDNELQQSFKMKGDRFAAKMAECHRREGSVPSADITNIADRMREQGRDPSQPEIADMMEEDELEALVGTRGTESENEDEESTVLALIRYAGRYREKASRIAELGMAEQLVFDQSGYLGNLTPKVQRWKTDNANSENPKTDKKTGIKELTAEARRAARNVKKQREAIGSQATFDPPRRRTRFDHNKTRYCLDLLRQNDIFFANDRVKFARGVATVHGFDDETQQVESDAKLRKASIVVPDRSEPCASQKTTRKLLKSSRGGLLGSLCDRILRDRTRIPKDRLGNDYFASSYELGTDRLHPDCNPLIPVVGLEYHLRYFEQARPDLREYERECVYGEDCWCNSRNTQIADNGTYFDAKNAASFIGKEGLLPDEEVAARTLGVLPKKHKPCFLCQFKETTQRVASLESSGTIPTRPINDHRVRVDEPGQYSKENCIAMTYNRSNKRVPTGIVGHYPQFNEIFFRHCVRTEGDLEIRYISYSPSVMGFC